MVPHTAPLQPAPLTPQVTDVFELPVTVAVNCWVAPAVTVVLVGETEIVTAGAAGAAAAAMLSVAGLLFALPALLVTATVNSASLSEGVVGGVV